MGARNVVFADSRASVRNHAERLGLQPIHPKELRGRGPAPLVVESSADDRGLSLALSKTAPDGMCSSAGTLHARVRLPVGLMYGRNATFHIARTHVRTLIPSVLELIVEGAAQSRGRDDHGGTIHDAPSALRSHVLGDATKTILTA